MSIRYPLRSILTPSIFPIVFKLFSSQRTFLIKAPLFVFAAAADAAGGDGILAYSFNPFPFPFPPASLDTHVALAEEEQSESQSLRLDSVTSICCFVCRGLRFEIRDRRRTLEFINYGRTGRHSSWLFFSYTGLSHLAILNYAKNSTRSDRFAVDLLFIHFHFIVTSFLAYVPIPQNPTTCRSGYHSVWLVTKARDKLINIYVP